MKGFERLSDELHKEGEPDVLRRVSLIVRHGRVEDPDPDTRFDLQAITFQFDRFFVNMVCRAEFDQVELLVDEQVRWPDMVISDISDDSPWRDIIGDYFFGHFWKMTNYTTPYSSNSCIWTGATRQNTSSSLRRSLPDFTYPVSILGSGIIIRANTSRATDRPLFEIVRLP